jgi:processive 1,2-diacylglycerol beta-glucosyltransferase
MAKLIDAETGALIGEISDDQLDFLIDQLEEEDREDQDYYLDLETIDLLEENGAEDSLVTLLRNALGSSEGRDVRWTR